MACSSAPCRGAARGEERRGGLQLVREAGVTFVLGGRLGGFLLARLAMLRSDGQEVSGAVQLWHGRGCGRGHGAAAAAAVWPWNAVNVTTPRSVRWRRARRPPGRRRGGRPPRVTGNGAAARFTVWRRRLAAPRRARPAKGDVSRAPSPGRQGLGRLQSPGARGVGERACRRAAYAAVCCT